jgi:hypothetical protein
MPVYLLVLVSDSVRDGKQAYYGYKDRRTVEDCFLDLKVKMCCDMFRTSSEDSLVGKCFVEFVALSLYMRMERDLRKLLDKNKPVPHHSVFVWELKKAFLVKSSNLISTFYKKALLTKKPTVHVGFSTRYYCLIWNPPFKIKYLSRASAFILTFGRIILTPSILSK